MSCGCLVVVGLGLVCWFWCLGFWVGLFGVGCLGCDVIWFGFGCWLVGLYGFLVFGFVVITLCCLFGLVFGVWVGLIGGL